MAKDDNGNKLDAQVARCERRDVDAAILAEAVRLYDAGAFVDSFHIATKAGPLQTWSGAAAQVFASRLAGNIGASRLASLLMLRAHREDSDHPDVLVHYGYHLLPRRGPLAAWRHT